MKPLLKQNANIPSDEHSEELAVNLGCLCYLKSLPLQAPQLLQLKELRLRELGELPFTVPMHFPPSIWLALVPSG